MDKKIVSSYILYMLFLLLSLALLSRQGLLTQMWSGGGCILILVPAVTTSVG